MTDVKSGRIVQLSKVKTGEDLSSQVGGGNKVFTWPYNYVPGTVKMFLNSLRQEKGAGKDFQETLPNQVTFEVAPEISDSVIGDCIKI